MKVEQSTIEEVGGEGEMDPFDSRSGSSLSETKWWGGVE